MRCDNCHEATESLHPVNSDSETFERWCSFCIEQHAHVCAICGKFVDGLYAAMVEVRGVREFVCPPELMKYAEIVMELR